MTLTILIVNWNRRDDLERLLQDLGHQTRRPDEIIVVDNGSQDGAPDMVASRFPGVRLIRLAENHGLSEGRNIGLAAFSSDLVAIMDNDLRVLDRRFVEKLCQSVETHADCGVISFHCINGLWQRSQVDKTDAVLTMAELVSLAERGLSPRPPRIVFDWFFWGGACVIRRDVLTAIGVFDEVFRYGGEEWDFAYRCHAAGIRLLRDDALWVVHVRSPIARSATADLMLLENMVVAQGRYLPAADLAVFLSLQLSKSVFDAVRSGRVGALLSTLRAIRMKWREEVWHKRHPVSAETMRLVYSLRLRPVEQFATARESRGSWLRFYAARAWRHLRGLREPSQYVWMVDA